ncbi:electron transport complex protein RnfC [Ruminococcus sp. YE71]|uniref:electron transport complex subunit RsxC n=1 Tax=unclassified Ruminococcus TaxID=2608920 RepID=UPI0008808263|nr:MULTISPECIES: electron transport complex subunit RsxC [unclassified Ruminococcus]SDA09680.1 electron transport complex protein RnfC [Ruminococcus sp. YE78]SFW11648.1 electron transport complex protein RnfC [Ruminococcus sp. YE71]
MKLRGVFLPHNKGTQDCACTELPLPDKIAVPMLMGIGAPCVPIVKKGDKVEVGQCIGDTDKLMSAPIHSPVSGKVTAVEDHLLMNGRLCKAVMIEPDGAQTISPEVMPPRVTERYNFCEAVRVSGCVGLGGAGLPTHIKLNVNSRRIDTLVINAAECEPYITSDCRTMTEQPDSIVDGIRQTMKYLEIERAVIGIEDNKPEAIRIMTEKTASDGNIEIKVLRSKYPQGAEKVMAYNTTGRLIRDRQLPLDQGLIVMNVSTVAFISDYLRTGMPLVSRRVTVDGDIVGKPMNVKALVGTPISDILRFADTDIEKAKKILMGGPMMGICIYDPDTPLIKVNNAILAFGESRAKPIPQTACISCGRCVSVCPLRLMPCRIEKAFDAEDKDTLRRLRADLCMNCGACSYVCPAKRRLAEKNQLAKELIRK